MKRSSKIIIYICVGLASLVLVWWIGSAAYSGWMGYKWEKKTEEFQLALSKPYREDMYGGKTPEETWGMFLDALKKGDVELASKYIVPEKQEEEKTFLYKEAKIDNFKLLLFQFSGKLQKDSLNSSEVDTARFVVPFKNNQGQMEANPVVFILNPYTKVWKISLL